MDYVDSFRRSALAYYKDSVRAASSVKGLTRAQKAQSMRELKRAKDMYSLALGISGLPIPHQV